MPGPYTMAAIEWYSGARGYSEPNVASLALCYKNGRCQFMQSEIDEGNYLYFYFNGLKR